MQKRRQWHRITIAAGCLLLAGVAAVAIVLVAGGEDQPPAPPTPPTSGSAEDVVLGVPARSVEPCSLADISSLTTYGRVQDPQDLGTYSSCTMDMYPTGGGSLRATVEFLARNAPDVTPPGVAEKRGDLSVYREPGSDGVCSRTILLGDRTPIVVQVEQFETGPVDPCIVAETMTKIAVTKLATSGIGRRADRSASSLMSADMCALVDRAALAAAGLDPSAAAPGFARWHCSWQTAAGVGLQVYADRQYENPEEQGSRITLAGREVVVQPRGYSGRWDRCVAQITQRRFLAGNGDQRVERVQLVFDGLAAPPDELCRTVTALAASAVRMLPSA